MGTKSPLLRWSLHLPAWELSRKLVILNAGEAGGKDRILDDTIDAVAGAASAAYRVVCSVYFIGVVLCRKVPHPAGRRVQDDKALLK